MVPKRDGYEHGVPSWVDLSTTGEDAARRFYEELFGWDWQGAGMPQGGTYWLASQDGELVAGLAKQPPQLAEHGVPSMWNTYVNVDSVDETAARAEAAGAMVISPPMDVGDSGRMAFVTDPSGAAIGMWQAGQHRGAGVMKEPGTLVWSEVYSRDTDATVAFYREVFGWDTGSMPMPGGGEYTLFKLGETAVGGTIPPPTEGMPPHWHTWFGSADVAAMTAAAQDLGATVRVPVTDTPMGPIASFEDPTGAVFSIIAPSRSG